MTFLDLLINFIFSYLATVGFSVFFNAPKKSLNICGIIGGIGWSVYILLSPIAGAMFSIVVSSAIISLLSEISARKKKYPAINFIIPGILPLVPGLGLYNTMYALVQEDYGLFASTGTDSILKSCGIAIGILIITSLTKTYYIILKKIKDKKIEENIDTN